MSALPPPRCPRCHDELVLGAQGELNPWSCRHGHGLGFTLTEAYERLQEDEIDQLWQRARAESRRGAAFAFCAKPMALVRVEADPDEVREGEEGDTPTTHAVDLDVCVDDQFIWFDPDELGGMPQDLPDPEPTAAELAAIERIRERFRAEMDAAWDDRDDDALSERLYRRVARHRGLHRTMQRIGDPVF